MLINYFRK